MTPQSFTPSGVTALQTELNALSASDLQTQVSAILSNFSSWLSTNFTLTTDQQTYLSGMDSQFLNYASKQTAFAVWNKLTISLSVSGEPTTFKLIHMGDDIVTTNSPDGFSTSGNLYFEVVYE